MTNCVIIEDDAAFALDTQIKAEEIGLNVIKVISNFKDIIPVLSNNEVDIILSDVKVGPDEYAFDALSKLSNLPPIIFFTNYRDDHLYKEASALDPYMYIIKPFDQLTLLSAVEGALKARNKVLDIHGDIERKDDLVFIRSKGKIVPIDPNMVIYVKTEGNYCYIHLENNKIIIRSSLNKVIAKFSSISFMQIHRSYLINLTYISNIVVSDSVVELKNISIPIGRKYKKELLTKLQLK